MSKEFATLALSKELDSLLQFCKTDKLLREAINILRNQLLARKNQRLREKIIKTTEKLNEEDRKLLISLMTTHPATCKKLYTEALSTSRLPELQLVRYSLTSIALTRLGQYVVHNIRTAHDIDQLDP